MMMMMMMMMKKHLESNDQLGDTDTSERNSGYELVAKKSQVGGRLTIVYTTRKFVVASVDCQ